MGKLEDLIFSHSDIATYGHLSADVAVSADAIPDVYPLAGPLINLKNKIRFLTKWRATGVTTNTVTFGFDNVRCWDGVPITLVTANMAQTNNFFPYIIAKGNSHFIITNSTGAAQTLSMFIEYVDIPDNPVMLNALKKYVNLNFKV
jgi:hypothetical protein